MRRFLRTRRAEILVALSLIAACLVFANLAKSGVINTAKLGGNKDAIDAASTLVTCTLLLLGGIFSYFRFFRGRTLAVRAEVSIEVSVHSSPHDFKLHSIQISVRNVGNSAIWDPKPELWITWHGDEPREVEVVKKWNDLPGCDDPDLATVIDTGESVLFFCQRKIPNEIWAVTYETAVRSASRDIWQSGVTVSNTSEDQTKRS